VQITKKWLVLALTLNALGVILGIWVSPPFTLLSLAPPLAAIVFDAYSPARFG
jgi:hypothetical protein